MRKNGNRQIPNKKSQELRAAIEVNEQYVSYAELAKAIRGKNALSIEILKNHFLFGNISSIVKILMGAAHSES